MKGIFCPKHQIDSSSIPFWLLWVRQNQLQAVDWKWSDGTGFHNDRNSSPTSFTQTQECNYHQLRGYKPWAVFLCCPRTFENAVRPSGSLNHASIICTWGRGPIILSFLLSGCNVADIPCIYVDKNLPPRHWVRHPHLDLGKQVCVTKRVPSHIQARTSSKVDTGIKVSSNRKAYHSAILSIRHALDRAFLPPSPYRFRCETYNGSDFLEPLC